MQWNIIQLFKIIKWICTFWYGKLSKIYGQVKKKKKKEGPQKYFAMLPLAYENINT